MASRAHLLAGLRTGGPRQGSSFDQSHDSFQEEAMYETTPAMLKGNAQPFTPGQPQVYDAARDLEARFAAMQMQQGSHDAMYGQLGGQLPRRPVSQHYPQQHHQAAQAQMQAQQVEQLIRQKQTQLVQNQLLQQYQEQQYQLETMRNNSHYDAHLQQLAAQQQMLLAQLQSNTELLNQQQMPAQRQGQHRHNRSMSAAGERQMAGMNMQASLRNRDASQAHASQQQQYIAEQNDLSQQHQLLLQRINGMRQASQGYAGVQESNAIPMRSTDNRSGSPGSNGQVRRDRQPSTTAADKAKSWRSSSTLQPAATASGRGLRGTPPPPSIIIDDSGSEKSDEPTSAELTTSIETPETSEEDVGPMLRHSFQEKLPAAPEEAPAFAPLAVRKRGPSGAAAGPAPRMSSLGAMPRQRNFASGDGGAIGSGSRIASSGSSSAGSVTPSVGGSSAPQPSRQPRGPPTEFHAVNFAARQSLRTRREAMFKLSASPRAASFTGASLSSVGQTAARRPSVSAEASP